MKRTKQIGVKKNSCGSNKGVFKEKEKKKRHYFDRYDFTVLYVLDKNEVKYI